MATEPKPTPVKTVYRWLQMPDGRKVLTKVNVVKPVKPDEKKKGE